MNHWKHQLKKYKSKDTETGYLNRVEKKYKSESRKNSKSKDKEYSFKTWKKFQRIKQKRRIMPKSIWKIIWERLAKFIKDLKEFKK